jgi:hypothetical protein
MTSKWGGPQQVLMRINHLSWNVRLCGLLSWKILEDAIVMQVLLLAPYFAIVLAVAVLVICYTQPNPPRGGFTV